MWPKCWVFTRRWVRAIDSDFTMPTKCTGTSRKTPSIVTDGVFGMWFVVIAIIYLSHKLYNYIQPWYWNQTASCKDGEEERVRMRDAIATTVVEQTIGIQISKWGWLPHDFDQIRRRFSSGLSHPDDVQAMHVSTCNRKHRYVENYRNKIGEEEITMIQR